MVSTTVEGRERYGIQVRYAREARDNIESIKKILINTKEGAQVPLGQVVTIDYVRGPQVIKSEDTFLTGYVTFGSKPGFAEVDVVEDQSKPTSKRMEKEGENSNALAASATNLPGTTNPRSNLRKTWRSSCL